MNSFSSWEPFIRSTWTCAPPPHPMHVTLFYNREGDLAYQEWFNTNLYGQFWIISIPGIVAGPEGIAAPVHLTPEQFQYYKMAPESAPHVILAVTQGGQAKALGPMIAKANLVTDCEESGCQPSISLEHFLNSCF